MYYQITLSIYFISIIVAFITSLTAYSKYNKTTYLKYFAPFLFLTLAVEVAAKIIAEKSGNNQFLFNFFSVFGFLFYFFILYKGIINKVVKKIILAIIVLYPLFALYMIFFIHGVSVFHTYSFGIGALLIVLICIYYFKWQFFETPIEVDIKRDPLVFICLGLTLFHSITFTYFSGIHLIKDLPPAFIQNMTLVCMICNYALYSFFAIAFLVNHKYSKIKFVEFPEIPKF
jgi:hypothetical protein